MIAKNEQDVISRALSCAKKFADEIIVADTGSTDDTVKIARSFGVKVYFFEWTDDFSAARNFSFSKATSDYVMWLDCDDVIDDENVKKLLSLKERLSNADIWYLKYATAFDSDGAPTFEYWRERIFRRSLGEKWTDPVHEVFYADGTRIFENITLRHEKAHPTPRRRNLDIYLNLISSGAELSPRQKFYFANELYQNRLIPLALHAYEDFLRSDGMTANKEQACINLSHIYSSLEDSEKALSALTFALTLGEPSAELCVALGNVYLSCENTDAAVFWYKAAIRPLPETTLAFVDVYCYNYYPYVQLGLCAYKKGDIKCAIDYTRNALQYKKNDEIASNNLAFFNQLIS